MPTTLLLMDRFSDGLARKARQLPGELLFLTGDTPSFLKLRELGYPVRFLHDFHTAEDVKENDKSCIEFVRSTFFREDNGRFSYKNVPMGHFVELYLIPYFIRIYRNVLCISKAIEVLEYDYIIVAGAGDFAETARLLLKTRGIAFTSWFSGSLARLSHALLSAWEGRKNQWVGSPLRDILFETLQNLVIIVDSYVRRLFSFHSHADDIGSTMSCLFLSGDHHTSRVRKMLIKSGKWRSVSFGLDYRYRKRWFRDAESLEGFFTLSIGVSAITAMIHFLFLWLKLMVDRNFQKRFEFQGVNYWERIRRLIKYNTIISFPRLYLNHLIGMRAFGMRPGSMLIVPSEEPPYFRSILHAAGQFGTKTMVIQHGVLAQPNGHDRISTDYYAAWGQRAFEWFGAFGDQRVTRKLHVVGAPRYDEYKRLEELNRERIMTDRKLPAEKRVILVLTEWSQDMTLSSTDLEDLYMLDAVVEALLALGLHRDTHIVVKPHPSGNEKLLREYWRRKLQESLGISVVRGRIEELLFISDICISGFSTALLEAMFFKKPVIVFRHFTKIELVPYASMGAALEASNASEMASAIRAIFRDRTATDNMLKNQEKFIEYAVYRLDGRSTERTCNMINGIMRGESLPPYIE